MCCTDYTIDTRQFMLYTHAIHILVFVGLNFHSFENSPCTLIFGVLDFAFGSMACGCGQRDIFIHVMALDGSSMEKHYCHSQVYFTIALPRFIDTNMFMAISLSLANLPSRPSSRSSFRIKILFCLRMFLSSVSASWWRSTHRQQEQSMNSACLKMLITVAVAT